MTKHTIKVKDKALLGLWKREIALKHVMVALAEACRDAHDEAWELAKKLHKIPADHHNMIFNPEKKTIEFFSKDVEAQQ